MTTPGAAVLVAGVEAAGILPAEEAREARFFRIPNGSG
jgi:hypothetical protein